MLEDIRGIIFSCTECKACNDVCSYYLSSRDESIGAWRRIKVVQSILNKEKTIDDIVRELYTCTCCGTCELTCPMNIPISDVVRSLRNLAVKEGKVPEPIANLCKNIISSGSMAGKVQNTGRSGFLTALNFQKKPKISISSDA